MKNLSITILFVSLCVVNCGLNAQEPRVGLTSDKVIQSEEKNPHQSMWKGAKIGGGVGAIAMIVAFGKDHWDDSSHRRSLWCIPTGILYTLATSLVGSALGGAIGKSCDIIQSYRNP
jgi:hypothetical protein